MKKQIKLIIGRIRSKLYNLKFFGGGYIGNRCNIKGGEHISMGTNVVIRSEVDMWANGSGITIEDGAEIGQRCRISIANSLTIGKEVLISPNVYITDCDHKYEDINVPVIKQGIVMNGNMVSIGDGSYIGINSVIVGDVHIGKHCIVGANSVVTNNIPDYCVAVGSPARIIKKYDFKRNKWMKV